MTLIVNDALNLTYYLAKTTLYGIYQGGKWMLYPESQQQKQLLQLPESPVKPAEPTEAKLLALFSNLPENRRLKCLCQEIVESNNELLQNFDLGTTGRQVAIEFYDIRTLHCLARLELKLDDNITIERLRKSLALHSTQLQPDLAVCDWYTTKLEFNGSSRNYSRVHISNSDFLVNYFETDWDASYAKEVLKIHLEF